MYHYTESGLNNVWLVNGYRIVKTPYGRGVAITNADGLHRVIALSLVERKPRLSGGDFRFLRKEIDLSQAALAELLGKDAQSVARWEKSGRVPKIADRLLRAIYEEHVRGQARIVRLVKRLGEVARPLERRLLFEETRSGWKMAKGGAKLRAA
jgi:DNA-binding transcriptional regulator YiaG